MDKNDLKRLFYRNESTFPFKKYVTNTKQKLNVYENYNVPVYEEDKVRQLLENINFPNNYLKTEVNICRYIHSAIFKAVSIYLLTVISRLFSETQPSQVRYVRIR